MSVSSAVQGNPASLATAAMSSASSRALSGLRMNAPFPVLMSPTSPPSPSASFLDRMEETISGMDSTVEVMSRVAYILRSAGASSAVCPMMATPVSPTMPRNCSSSGLTSNPGMASSLSRVPPVWPRPRPEIIGT